MKWMLIAMALGLGISAVAHADDAAVAQDSNLQPAVEDQQSIDQPKSFFDSRSLEDIQQLVNSDLKQFEISGDMSGAG